MDKVLNELYISVDLETAGDNPLDFTILNVGMVAYAVDPQRRRKVGELSVNMIPGTPDPKQVEWWNSTPKLKAIYESFAVDAKSPDVAMVEIRDWLAAVRQGYEHVYMVACPTIFDGTFLLTYWFNFLPSTTIRGTGMFHMIDVRSYGAGRLGCSLSEANKTKAFAPYMPDPEAYPHTHTGVDDAEEQLLLLFNLMDLRKNM